LPIERVCQTCEQPFETNIVSTRKFCSRICTDKGRSLGIIGTKKRRGASLICEVCLSPFYRQQSMVKNGRSRFCSEPCRLRAHELKMIDRTQPRPNRLLGAPITCMFCGKTVYRKKSMLSRNIGKTCGSQECISAYGRSLWGLEPHEDSRARLPRARRKYRGTANFNAAQRATWIDDHCARCGSTENLMLDHITAVCNGGTATRENAQTLCGSCNNWKMKNVDRVLARRRQASSGG
jgi:hypothetical protein